MTIIDIIQALPPSYDLTIDYYTIKRDKRTRAPVYRQRQRVPSLCYRGSTGSYSYGNLDVDLSDDRLESIHICNGLCAIVIVAVERSQSRPIYFDY